MGLQPSADVSVARLLGVYDADGGLVGELRYIVGHLLGRAECSLCDITHSPVRRKPAWDRMVATLGVPFDLVHRNEVPPAFSAALAGVALPVVLAELTDGRTEVALDAATLATCDGDIERFAAALDAWTPQG
jgi:hypothetical protein